MLLIFSQREKREREREKSTAHSCSTVFLDLWHSARCFKTYSVLCCRRSDIIIIINTLLYIFLSCNYITHTADQIDKWNSTQFLTVRNIKRCRIFCIFLIYFFSTTVCIISVSISHLIRTLYSCILITLLFTTMLQMLTYARFIWTNFIVHFATASSYRFSPVRQKNKMGGFSHW